VWAPPGTGCKAFYPGPQFVDWIGVSILNYAGEKEEKDWHSFKDIYSWYRKELGSIQKPVMITELGCRPGQDQAEWLSTAFENMRGEFHEIKSALLLSGEKKIVVRDQNNEPFTYIADFSTDRERIAPLKEMMAQAPFAESPFF